MDSEEKEIKIHSEEVQEIIETPPKWMFRNGISIIAVLIALVVVTLEWIDVEEFITVPFTIDYSNSGVYELELPQGTITVLKEGTFAQAGDTIVEVGGIAKISESPVHVLTELPLFEGMILNERTKLTLIKLDSDLVVQIEFTDQQAQAFSVADSIRVELNYGSLSGQIIGKSNLVVDGMCSMSVRFRAPIDSVCLQELISTSVLKVKYRNLALGFN